MSVQDIDHGLDAFVKEMKRINRSHTKIGVQSESRYLPDSTGSTREGGEDIVAVAAALEFGKGKTPEYAPIRRTTDDERSRVDDEIAKGLEQIKQGKTTAKHVLATVGEYMKGKIQAKIVEIRTPANSDETIARKGSDNPMIDTGQFRMSIQHVEVMRG